MTETVSSYPSLSSGEAEEARQSQSVVRPDAGSAVTLEVNGRKVTLSPAYLSSLQKMKGAILTDEELYSIMMEKQAEVQVMNRMTRRKAVIIIVVVLLVVAAFLIIAAVVITVQIQNVVGQGPEPPISSYITNTPVLGTTGVGIPQGGSLISRPNFFFSLVFTTDVYFLITGTAGGGIIWNAGLKALTTNSQALLQLTDQGILLVWLPDGTTYPVSNNTPGPVGGYRLQVVEFLNPDFPISPGNGGQVQIVDENGIVVWFAGTPLAA